MVLKWFLHILYMKNDAEVCRNSLWDFRLAGELFVFMHRNAKSLQAPENE